MHVSVCHSLTASFNVAPTARVAECVTLRCCDAPRLFSLPLLPISI